MKCLDIFDRIDLNALELRTIARRRDLHKYPEAFWREYRTTVKIIELLEELKIPYHFGKEIHDPNFRWGLQPEEDHISCMQRAIQETGRPDLINQMAYGYTGVVGVLDSNKPGPVAAIRFDIDSNELNESTSTDHFPVKHGFSSVHPGFMHACGHDGHTAYGMAVAEILSAYRDSLKGKVLLFFQPAEEGGRGAPSLVNAGLFDDVDYLYGGHIGISATKNGLIGAGCIQFLSASKIEGTFNGKSAHAGKSPQSGHNALAAAATAATNCLAIARTSEGQSRINIGYLQSGTSYGVIPEYAVMKIETRGESIAIDEYMFNRALEVCQGAASMFNCSFSHVLGGPRTASDNCDLELTNIAAAVAGATQGVTEVVKNMKFGGGEDFCSMMQRVHQHNGKATFLQFGSQLSGPHHNSKFNFDESVLIIAAQILSGMTFKLLSY